MTYHLVRCNRSILFSILGLYLLLPVGAIAQSPTKRVLVVASYDLNRPAVNVFLQSMRSTITGASRERVEFFYEFQENTRIPTDKYEAAMVSYMQRKYEGEKFDLAIALGAPAVKTLLNHEAEIFTATPKIFYFHDETEETVRSLWPRATGVWAQLGISKSLNLALELQPETNRVVVVSGSSAQDRFLQRQAQTELRTFEGKLEVTYVSDLSMAELKNRLASLPPKTVILYLSFFLDSAGNSYSGPEALSAFAPTASAPVYGISETYMGAGIVGGSLINFEALGQRTGEIALHVLAGEQVSKIPPESVPNVQVLDWRQLKRWGIDERRVPANSTVRFKTPTFWDQYKWYVLAVITVVIIESSLIAWLLLMRARRRQAEASVLQSEERFRKAFRSNPQPMSLTTIDEGRYLDVNDSFLSMSGYTRDELVGHTSLELGIWETAKTRVDFIEQLKKHGSVVNTETRFRSNDGSMRLLLSSAEELQIAGERCLLLASTDITERKKAEEALREAHEQLRKLKDQLEAENIYLQEELKGDRKFGEIVGQSDAIMKVLHHINVVAPTEATVLITGETGTGKELVARAIHAASSRHDRPLIKVNCGALPSSLIETELFGHEKGAFTGAGSQKAGRFELANGGTIFLDEIGELALESQVKLLRVIQEGEFERVGGSKTIKIDVRIIAATNRNLKVDVDNGTFREDLWYRLNVFPITVPPLRHRREDIPLLTEHFVRRFAHQFGKNITGIAPATVKALREYSWPGNVRELANVLERGLINTNGPVLRLRENLELVESPTKSSPKTLTEVERDYIIGLLEDCGWRVEGAHGAARVLGLNPSTLRSKMSKLGIKRILNNEDTG